MYGLHFTLPPVHAEVRLLTLKGIEEFCHVTYLVGAFLGSVYHVEHAHILGGWASLGLLAVFVVAHLYHADLS